MSDDLGRAPTRRSLREQRRAGEAADEARDRDPSTPDQPATDSETRSSDDTNQLERVAKANRSRRAADVPFDMVPERGERSSLQRARDREALRARREAANREAAQREAAQRDATSADDERTPHEAAPLTRRQLRLQALAAARAAGQAPSTPEGNESTQGPVAAGAATPAEPAETGNSLSVEAALEARRKIIAEQPKIQKPTADETDADDLEVIARQRELAARAAIISRRVAERERLQRSNSERTQQAADPFTGAMNRLRIEQAERDLANTGVNAPHTNGFRLEMPAQSKPAGKTAPAGEQDRDAPKASKPARKQASSGQAVEGQGTETGGQPVSARSAQGLEPLDYLTAGVRRVNAWTVAVIAALAVGAGALVTGIVMISTNG
ncbi:hypothetical protein [Arthrobacter sp. JSM 101049]|uniref:hypothetical protein n=1 Tax=Arthrobacter sp. JSM 101049 TaxID=929097 RepID=UPI0035659622